MSGTLQTERASCVECGRNFIRFAGFEANGKCPNCTYASYPCPHCGLEISEVALREMVLALASLRRGEAVKMTISEVKKA